MKPSPKKRSGKRDYVGGSNQLLAEYGWYSAAVQSVVEDLDGKVLPELLKRYFRDVAPAALGRAYTARIKVLTPMHWPHVWKLAQALGQVLEKGDAQAWLLRNIDKVTLADNWRYKKWEELAWRSGHTSAALSKAAQRLKLVPPGEPRSALSET